MKLHLTSWPLKVRPIHCPETSVKDYYLTLRNTSEERRSQKKFAERNIRFCFSLEANFVMNLEWHGFIYSSNLYCLLSILPLSFVKRVRSEEKVYEGKWSQRI
jgi:hypothetical protein